MTHRLSGSGCLCGGLGERETGGRKIRKGQGNSREAFPQKRDGDRWPEEQIGVPIPI